MKIEIEADPFDIEKFPFGKVAGENKMDMKSCPTCKRPPTHPTKDEYPWPESEIPEAGFYMFRNELSAQEYYISAMCQHCQDATFGAD